MNILVICQYYHPEPFRIIDICEELVRLGHAVTVVTGTPNYPMGEIYPGYEHGQRCDEMINGVKVHRCKTCPRKTGAVHRLKNYFSYAHHSNKYIKTLSDEFDVVFVNQLSPVMMAKAGITYKRKYGKKMVLYCLDLWPESLCVGGIKKTSPIFKFFNGISRRIYRSADEILVTSFSFKEHLSKKFAIDEKKIVYLPQYAEGGFLSLTSKEPTVEFHLVFAGNIGTAQSIHTIVEAARILREERIMFHIVGDGSELEKIKAIAADLPHVIFYGRKPLAEMPRYYEMADAMLVTLIDDPMISLTLPGKIQTYMAAGKPIVGAANGETALTLQEAQGGYCGAAENAAQLAENIVALMRSGQVREVGQKNRKYYTEKFAKEQFLQLLTERLKCATEG